MFFVRYNSEHGTTSANILYLEYTMIEVLSTNFYEQE